MGVRYHSVMAALPGSRLVTPEPTLAILIYNFCDHDDQQLSWFLVSKCSFPLLMVSP